MGGYFIFLAVGRKASFQYASCMTIYYLKENNRKWRIYLKWKD